MEKEIKIKGVCSYSGHSINQQGIFNLTLVFAYDELTNIIQLMQCLNEDIELVTKISGETKKLGTFGIKNIAINSNGESKVKFTSFVHSVETDNINRLVSAEYFKIGFISRIDIDEP